MAMTPFAWRRATLADLPALASLYETAACELGPRVYTLEQTTAWVALARDDAGFRRYVMDADTWVAEGADDAGLLGFCGVGSDGDFDRDFDRDVVEIRSLYVRPSVGRQGIGSDMLRRTLRGARSRGARRFVAWATPFSRPVFVRAGFAWTRTVAEPFAGVMFERYLVECTADADIEGGTATLALPFTRQQPPGR